MYFKRVQSGKVTTNDSYTDTYESENVCYEMPCHYFFFPTCSPVFTLFSPVVDSLW